MNAPIPSATHNSAVRSYYLASGLWLVLALLEAAFYRHALISSGGDTRSSRFALFFLLQAIWIPIYVSRKTFQSAAEAAIRSAAAAVAFGGLAFAFPGTIQQLLGITVSSAADPRLQIGYMIPILLLNGVVAGAAIGLLRWLIVRERPEQPASLSPSTSWRKDLRSQLIWIACAALSAWFFTAYAVDATHHREVSLMPLAWKFSEMLGRLPLVVGLILIPPIPFVLPPRERESRGIRIMKYSASAFTIAFAVAAMISLPAIMWAPVIFPHIFLNFCIPALLWGVLYALSLPPF